MPRIVVYSGDYSFSVRKGILEIDCHVPGTQWLLIRHAPPRALKSLMRSQVKNIRKHGARWLTHQALSMGSRVLDAMRATRCDDDTRGPGTQYLLSRMLARPNMRLVETRDLNGAEAQQLVRDFAPDLGLSLAAPILRPPLFDLPRLGTLNLHKGRVPDYRGMPPAFWELWNDEREVGCTVHLVAAGLDTGDIVEQGSVTRRRFSTLRSLQLALDELGVDLMCRAVVARLSGTATPHGQPPGGHTYRKPTLQQAAQLAARLREAQPPQPPAWYRWGKSAYLFARLHAGRLWLALFTPSPTVAVILYHRINDDMRDSLTTGVEQFDRQMALVRRYCTPISIEDVVRGDYPKRPRKPLVCVTFDDGYEDNFANAVPLLLRHRVPCAFFVSTGFIGSQNEFPHDGGKVPMPLGNMTWEQLKRMREDGFVIGSHTVNHINCAAGDDATVRGELKTSLERLRDELGLTDVILAYPFGGREHMTPQRLAMVEETGYVGCLSAYGGFNRGTVARFNVLRCGVNWGFSDIAFRCRIWGLL